MNPVSFIMACFSILGALDLITGNHVGIGKEFEKGLMLLGTMALSMVGMIVIAPLLSELLFPPLEKLSNVIPFDPSSIVGSLLANDMGGAPLSLEFAKTEKAGYFNGLIVGSMMGATISFTLPFAMSAVKKEQHKSLLFGMMCGICAIPVGCFVSGLLIRMSLKELFINLIPLLLFSAILTVGLLKIPDICVKIFNVFGIFIKAVILVGLAAGIFEFLTGIEILPYSAPIEEGMDVIVNAAMVISGAFPLVYLVSKLLKKPLQKLGEKIGINSTSALGFLCTLATNVTTLSMIKDMDEKGVVLNSAFAVSAAFTFAGHLAFTIAFNADYLLSMIVGKLIAGFAALAIAALLFKRVYKKNSSNELPLTAEKELQEPELE